MKGKMKEIHLLIYTELGQAKARGMELQVRLPRGWQ